MTTEQTSVTNLYAGLTDKQLLSHAGLAVSIERGYLTANDFLTNNYFQDRREFYFSSDKYVLLHDHFACEKEKAFLCSENKEYYSISERLEVITGIADNDKNIVRYISRSAFSFNSKYCRYETDFGYKYYTRDALECFGLVFTQDNGVMDNEEAFLWSNGLFYSYKEPVEYLRSYHNDTKPRFVLFDGKSPYRIGYEVEKEDIDVKESLNIDDFEELLPDWRKERDGSLNDDSGYELVSPVFELNIPKIFGIIEKSEVLKEHINAKYTRNCGGHINLSHIDKKGEEVFDLISGYVPLLYALYYGRVNKTYSYGKNINRLKSDGNEKYQAIRIGRDRIEFRIFSAVHNVDTLRWRTELIALMLKYPTSDVGRAFYYISTRFNKHLKKMYGDSVRFDSLKERIVDYSMSFESVNVRENLDLKKFLERKTKHLSK